MKIRMKNDKLLLELIKQDDVSKDGVIYTESQRHKSFKGKIIATDGYGDYELGDVVIFSEYAGENVHIDGKDCLIIGAENIWGIEEDEENPHCVVLEPTSTEPCINSDTSSTQGSEGTYYISSSILGVEDDS